MTKTIKALPLFIGLPLICFLVQPIRATIEQLVLLKKIWLGNKQPVAGASGRITE